MKVVVGADARSFRRAIGLTAWAVLEELLLDAHVDDHSALIARTNVRRLASQLGVSKDTAARAISRLVRAGVVERVVAERGPRGALPTSRYRIDLAQVDGVTVAADAQEVSPATESLGAFPHTRPRSTRQASRIDDAQTSLFDVPASIS